MLSCSWVVELPRISLLSQSAWWFHENLWTYLSSVESGHFGIIQKYGSNRIWTKPPTTYYFWWVWIDRYIMRYLRRFIGDVDGFPSWWICVFLAVDMCKIGKHWRMLDLSLMWRWVLYISRILSIISGCSERNRLQSSLDVFQSQETESHSIHR